ncbi:MAG: DUF3667 domain-containing protein [Ignavibacteriae bacterium]|nr:DUF3667 domain-containing protein [Ignavibacteriota bacterium]MCB9208421.1 DUF3667 domain-containing protein [Ignavibacteriales bacterium]MCB9258471.1 DUF3667 domain-containing protein [Ignavibacteriales bacterium]
MTKIDFEKKICPSCGNAAEKYFCSNCGEKLEIKGYSLNEFFSNILEGFYNFDSRFLRSLKYLIFKPGFLTNEFLIGRRVNYTRPFQLFIILNLIMLITSSFFNESIFSSSLFGHTNNTPYKKFAQNLIMNAHLEQNLTFEQYEIKFNNRLDNYSRTLIFLYIPIFAMALMLITRKRYFYEHLIHSIHSVSFILLVFGLIITPIIIILHTANSFGLIVGVENIDAYILPILAISLVAYFYFSVRRFYNNTRFLSLIKSIFLLGAFFILFMFYRFLLFIFVFYSIKLF